ncbi:MAG TPA: hypothetical protein VIU83_06295, partial [Candidatus Deferrimicrobium sp.]
MDEQLGSERLRVDDNPVRGRIQETDRQTPAQLLEITFPGPKNGGSLGKEQTSAPPRQIAAQDGNGVGEPEKT